MTLSNTLYDWMSRLRRQGPLLQALVWVSLIGLLLIQGRLILSAIEYQRQYVEDNMDRLLLEVHHRIEEDAALSDSLIRYFSTWEAGRELSPASGQFLLDTLSRIVEATFVAQGMGGLQADLALYHAPDERLILSSDSTATLLQPYLTYSERAGYRVREALGQGQYRFGISFRNFYWYLGRKVYLLLGISLLFILLLGVSFYHSLAVIRQQKQRAEMKNHFINNLTHELKTPIFSSSLVHRIMRKQLEHNNTGALAHHLSLLEKENRQLKDKVEKVLELAALENAPRLRQEAVDMHAVIRDRLAVFRVIAADASGRIECALEAENPVIHGDPAHLGNILDNLIENALKYGPARPEISIRTRQRGDRLEIAIRDNGPGIPYRDQPFVFDKYYRVSEGDRHSVKGFGLGLSYVRHMVAMHHGQIRLYSRPGRGSTFVLQFPLHHAPQQLRHEAETLTG